jgi:hypothetical protein
MTMMTYEQFWDGVQSNLDAIQSGIHNAIQWVCDEFNRRIDEMPLWKKALPWVAIAVNRAVDALTDGFNAIWDAFEAALPGIWAEAREVEGDPLTLMLLVGSYNAAKSELHNIGTVYLPDAVGDVAAAWKSEGADAFVDTAGRQVAAVLGVKSGLDAAAKACADAANQIIQSWQAIIAAVLDYASSIVDAIKEGTDAGQILTLEVGPTVKVIGDLVVRVLELGNELAGFIRDGATTGAAMWADLDSGIKGLMTPGNTWPTIPGLDAEDMNDPARWKR